MFRFQALVAGDLQEALGYYDRSLVFNTSVAVYNNRALLCQFAELNPINF